VEIRVGPAAESLRALAAEQAEPFDFVFIDADKTGYPGYLTLVLPLVKPGSVILADNTVRDGKVADAGSTDPDVQAVRQFHEMVAKNARLSGTAIQTVGGKGYDGFTMVVVQ
jgi:predicted O-methyltransferase YrrM